jgi:hypothetical protein
MQQGFEYLIIKGIGAIKKQKEKDNV